MADFPLRILGRRRFLFAALLCIYLIVAGVIPRGFALTAFGDIVQALLLAGCTIAASRQGVRTAGRPRLFWILLALGFGTWFLSQADWTYYEVFLRQEVPNPFGGDVLLFLHIVPLMGALAVRPQLREDQSARFTSLDFLLLMLWWLYLYLFIVIPWQFHSLNLELYGTTFNALYLLEHAALLVCLFFAKRSSPEPWRTIYTQFLCASSLYAASSIAAGVAIDFGRYYTGSLYDLPLVGAEIWFLYLAFDHDRAPEPEPTGRIVLHDGIWPARVAMLAVFSTPLMILWAAFGGHAPTSVRDYRLILTAVTMLLMGALVFLKQRLLDRELIALIHTTHESFEQMRSLKEEVENKEQQLRWHSVELQRKNLELQQASLTDTLTGVWNRRYLEEVLDSEISQALRSHYREQDSLSGDDGHSDLVFIMVDVDFFKHVNDDYGHVVGDELLRKFAERLSRVVRKSDVLVRWGGEEFLVVSRSTNVSGASVFCQRLLEVVAGEPFVLAKEIKIRKTCSIGWAAYPWVHSTPEALCAEEIIEMADSALYLAKASGRNQSIGFVPSAAALANVDEIRFETIRDSSHGFVRVIKTDGPAPRLARLSDAELQNSTEA